MESDLPNQLEARLIGELIFGAMPEYKKFSYRLEFPDSDESARSHQSLEDALEWARWRVQSVWRETNQYGAQGNYITHACTGVITNRNTGYRWILRRHEYRVEFQTAEMYEKRAANESIQVHLTIEEAEALARAANAEASQDKRTRALVGQALDQTALLCRQVRERVCSLFVRLILSSHAGQSASRASRANARASSIDRLMSVSTKDVMSSSNFFRSLGLILREALTSVHADERAPVLALPRSPSSPLAPR